MRVGIVTWNSAEHLPHCLAALPRALGPLPYEVTVVDNASSDSSAGVAAAFDRVRVLIHAANEGYAVAMNRAFEGARTPVLIALNPDTIPPPGSLAALVERLLADERVGLVAPRLVLPDGSDQFSAFRFPSWQTALTEHPFWPSPTGRLRGWAWRRGHGRDGSVDWATGAVHVIRRAAVTGPTVYCERWFMYNEDLDLCWRMARRGWRRLLADDVSVLHVGNASGANLLGRDPSRWTLASTYDWYGQVHGRAEARRFALLRIGASLVHGALLSAGSFVRYRVDRRTRALQLWGQLALHVSVVVFGPPPPLRPPSRGGPLPGERPANPWRWPPM